MESIIWELIWADVFVTFPYNVNAEWRRDDLHNILFSPLWYKRTDLCHCFLTGTFSNDRGRQWLRQLAVHRKHNQPPGFGVTRTVLRDMWWTSPALSLSLSTVYINKHALRCLTPLSGCLDFTQDFESLSGHVVNMVWGGEGGEGRGLRWTWSHW